MKKIVLLAAVLTCFFSCPGELPNRITLNVPYYPWLADGYCAIACIQMWGAYDGIFTSQSEIANAIGTWPNPYQVANGVNMYTNSVGWLEFESAYNPYNQDLCIAYSIASVQDSCPSIMPFYGGQEVHSILAIGFQWHEDGAGTPIAEYITYHDPDSVLGPSIEISGSRLKSRFLPSNGYYFTIVGRQDHIDSGIGGYNAFCEAGGTYYGAPPDYRPNPVL